MRIVNITMIVENIVSLLRPYKTEILLVPSADRPYVLRRIQRELRHRIHSDCSAERLQRYRELDSSLQADLEALE